MKHGSIFDGIGGFPLAAVRQGIEPVWASEIESEPVAITTRHFPEMVHLGDVTKIDGASVEPVDVVTFGSPCQDLSVAGKRAGLEGARSGLFLEAVRIIKEIRGANGGKYPRFAIWENVPGAFSSNSGEDFRVVVEAMCRIADESFAVPAAKWEPAGLVEGNGWSIAWRVLDAQFWGVPQRRKRIFLVADFAGGSAGQILFKRESLRGHPAEGEGAGQGAAADAAGGAGASGGVVGNKEKIAVCATGEKTHTLTRRSDSSEDGTGRGTPIIATGFYSMQAIGEHKESSSSSSLKQRDYKAATDLVVSCYDPKDLGRRPATFEEQSPAIKARCGTGGGNIPVTLAIRGRGDSHQLEYRMDDTANALLTPNGGRGGMGVGAIAHSYRVRRLTPTECERLQGFPDGWTEGFSDTVRYKALGNSVAIPCVEFVMEGLMLEWMLS